MAETNVINDENIKHMTTGFNLKAYTGRMGYREINIRESGVRVYVDVTKQ